MSDHSIISPSSAFEWVHCAGSVTMQASYPESDTPDSLAGSASHDIAKGLFAGIEPPATGSVYENGVVITDEMVECAQLYVDDVIQTAGERGITPASPMFYVEHRVHARETVHPESWGTVDCWFFDEVNRDLFIYDYKFGHGIVEAFENWQCLNYAAGILELLRALGHDTNGISVWMNVTQPRSHHKDGPIRHWWDHAQKLTPYFERLARSAAVATRPGAKCLSGEHCRYCTARHACPAIDKAALVALDYSCDAVPDEMPPSHVGLELELMRHAVKRLNYRISGLETQTKSIIHGGGNVPGQRVEMGYGHLKWDRSVDEVVALGDVMGLDLRNNKTITPTQAKKLGLDETLIKSITSKPESGLKVVPDDGSFATRIFAKES